jgi:hypothetical protein
MEQKTQALLNELHMVFDGDVEYRFENELHKFRLKRNGPSHWLYVARNFVDDHTIQELIDSLSGFQIPDALRNSPQSRWLFLSETGIYEVDDNFGCGHQHF